MPQKLTPAHLIEAARVFGRRGARQSLATSTPAERSRRARRLDRSQEVPGMRHVALVASIVLVLADCAGGKEFARPAAEELRLGQTTEQDVRQRMGEPTRTSSTQRNGETMTTLSYGYALAIPYVDDVKTRAMGFYFARGVLVGYEFTSSFPEDKTRFDDSKVSQIKRGETTRQDVIALFGTPGGQYAHPMVTDPAGLALVYLFIDADRHPFGAAVRRRQKLLIVTCDSQGVVRDVQYTTSEVK